MYLWFKGIDFDSFLQLFYLILELFRQRGIFFLTVVLYVLKSMLAAAFNSELVKRNKKQDDEITTFNRHL
jgi:uncharacterized protein YllA (UPF0747 family)